MVRLRLIGQRRVHLPTVTSNSFPPKQNLLLDSVRRNFLRCERAGDHLFRLIKKLLNRLKFRILGEERLAPKILLLIQRTLDPPRDEVLLDEELIEVRSKELGTLLQWVRLCSFAVQKRGLDFGPVKAFLSTRLL